jgi:hypothetical protein
MLSYPGYCQKEIAFVPTPINFIIKNAGVKVLTDLKEHPTTSCLLFALSTKQR